MLPYTIRSALKGCSNNLNPTCNFFKFHLLFSIHKHRHRSSRYHVRYLSHLALQVGFSNWVHKTPIHSIQRWQHFGAKTSQFAFLLEKQLHPSLYWIQYSWSGLTIILYYINLPVRWNTLLRNQISPCQHVFYYTTINWEDLHKMLKW